MLKRGSSISLFFWWLSYLPLIVIIIIMVGGTSTGISPPILLRTFGYSRPILVAVRSLSLKPISFGYKTPPIRSSQAGGQSAHKARPPHNLELALTWPLIASRCSTTWRTRRGTEVISWRALTNFSTASRCCPLASGIQPSELNRQRAFRHRSVCYSLTS